MSNIAVLCDGTTNRMHADERAVWTNVAKLAESIGAGRDGARSLYVPGIGTHGAVERLLGPATGYGIEQNIKDAYRHICAHYAPGRDNIYLFGFSRGAYTVRSLAGFVRHVGLLLANAIDEHIEQAFAYYWWGETVASATPLRKHLQNVTGKAQPGDNERVLIYFIGVWDSVGTLGLPWFLGAPLRRWTRYHRVQLPDHVTYAYQALALHELRAVFAPVLWTHKLPSQTLEQVWFPGAHADVGGGYRETALADVALRWMTSKVRRADPDPASRLDIDFAPPATAPNPAPEEFLPHNTIVDEFEAFDPEVRPLFRSEFDDDGLGAVWDHVKLHDSVQAHWRNDAARDYRYGIGAVNQRLREVDDRSLRFHLEQRERYGIDLATD